MSVRGIWLWYQAVSISLRCDAACSVRWGVGRAAATVGQRSGSWSGVQGAVGVAGERAPPAGRRQPHRAPSGARFAAARRRRHALNSIG